MADRGNYDPGWNDPPTFSYSPENNAAKPKNVLNKRVPFSTEALNANKSNAAQIPSFPPMKAPPPYVAPPKGAPPPYVAPPMRAPPPYMPPPSVIKPTIDGNSIDSEKMNSTLNIFNGILEKSPELGSKADVIRKRISIMENMWNDGKLSMDIQTKTFQLANALGSSDTKLADELHKSLMVDHPSVVGTWMVGIKQLILHLTAVNELLEIDRTEQD